MQRPSVLLGFGALCLVIFLLTSMPASVFSYIAGFAGVKVVDPTGSVWNGQARSIRADGVLLQRTHWKLHPAALLTGQLRIDLDSRLIDGFVRTQLSLRPGSNVVLRNLELASSVQGLSGIAHLPVNQGQLSLKFNLLELNNAWPVAAIGELRVRDIPLGLAGSAAAASPAGFRLLFDQPEPAQALVGVLNDTDGPVELEGELRLTPPRNYAVDARARVRAGASDEIRQGLLLLGAEASQGWRTISFAGSL